MNVSLTQELEEFVQRKVASGLYTSASEVIREGLRLLEEQERLKESRLQVLRDGSKRAGTRPNAESLSAGLPP
jgi:antitoxin ParD1/3/4